MDLKQYLEDIIRVGESTIKQNCWDGQHNVLEGIQSIMSKINEVIDGINSGMIKGDKGELGLKGDKGEKGDKGDTGIASETIDDSVTNVNHTWSSSNIEGKLEIIKECLGLKGNNLFNGFLKLGSINGGTGEDEQSSVRTVTDFIPISSGSRYGWVRPDSVGGFIFVYDKNRKFTGTSINIMDYQDRIINGKYIRFRLNSNDVDNNIQLVKIGTQIIGGIDTHDKPNK